MRVPPPLARAGSLCLALLISLFAGCGAPEQAEAPAAIHVRILTSEADGPPEGAILLRGVVQGEEREVEARPSGSEPGIFVAEGLPTGAYHVSTSAGWGMLWSGSGGGGLPLLRATDLPATSVRLGRPRCLYVGASNPGARHGHVTAEWGADWHLISEGSGSGFRPAEIEAVLQGDGLVALRFTEEAWGQGHGMRACGLFESGAVSRLITFPTHTGPRSGLPRLALTMAAPLQAFAVHLLPGPGLDAVPDGRPVTLSPQEIPLRVVYQAASQGGTAQFTEVGSIGDGYRVALPDLGIKGSYLLTNEELRTRGEIHLIALDPDKLVDVPLDAGDATITEVRARFAGSSEAGLVPLWQADGKQMLSTQPGLQHWLLQRADGSWWEHDADVAQPGEARVSAEKIGGEARKPARVRGVIDGGGAGFRVRFTLLLESGERVTGAGFSAASDGQGDYEALLPPGRYEVQVLRRGGAPARPRVLPLGPGQDARVDLSSR